jgi:hypothetical protein
MRYGPREQLWMSIHCATCLRVSGPRRRPRLTLVEMQRCKDDEDVDGGTLRMNCKMWDTSASSLRVSSDRIIRA